MKIFQIVPDVSYEANGVTPVINGLSCFFSKNGHDVTVCSLGANIPDSGVRFLKANRSKYFDVNEFSSDFSLYLKEAFNSSDIVHGHSLWSFANILTGLLAGNRRAKLVVSPHGTLTSVALSRRRLIKKVLWPIQRLALTRADMMHATSESEVEDIRRAGYAGPIALIANGVEVPDVDCESDQKRKKLLLFLGRIHPIKGIENLLLAWLKVKASHKDWELVIAGVGVPEYERSLKNLSSELNLHGVSWAGAAYGLEKAKLYQEASLFVLPSYSENFAMVVAEALANRCPAVVSQGAPWGGLQAEECGWWVSNSVESLVHAIDAAMQLPADELQSMGLRGRAWMERDFGWSAIGQKMDAAYHWLVYGGPQPAWVRTIT